MKNYCVTCWVNYRMCQQWRFEDEKESLDFFKDKIDNLAKERKEDNKIIHLEDEESYGYVWQDKYGRVIERFKKWKEVKNEN